MPQYTYNVKDNVGKTLKGIVEAISLKQAIGLLHERGFYIIEIKEAFTSPLPFQSSNSGIKLSFNNLVHITRQLATMITAGLTLIEALAILRQQVNKPAIIKFISQIEDEVRSGKSFAQTLEKYPKVFPPIYLALVHAGEASGKLDVILTRLADNLEKSRDFRNKIKGAMTYPAIIVGGMVTVACIVMTVVVPRLTSLYKEFGATLPLPTRILMAASEFLLATWWLIIFVVPLIIVFLRKLSQTNLGKHILALMSLKLPIIGTLVRESNLVELTRTLSLLVDGGVPILTALDISQNATGNILFRESFAAAAKRVEKGFPLSDPLSSDKFFPPILGQMVMVGEQTGKLSDSLLKLSHYFETEAETATRALTTMIEPLIMIVLGIGVGFMVIAVLLPIYSLTSKF